MLQCDSRYGLPLEVCHPVGFPNLYLHPILLVDLRWHWLLVSQQGFGV